MTTVDAIPPTRPNSATDLGTADLGAANLEDRAAGALWGLALGDALGMPTQVLSPQAIARRYGRIDGFVAPDADHPVSHGLPAAAVTDDTEQTMLLARHLIGGKGRLDPVGWARALLDWEAGVAARGLSDLLGPSTRRAIDALLAGEPADTAGRTGDTNGAAMRIAPVAIATPAEPLGDLVDRVAEISRPTHNTGLAIAAAAAVAAAISAALDGADLEAAEAAALAAAGDGATRGHWVAGADIAARLEMAIALAREVPADMPMGGAVARIAARIGTSVAAQESVPTAFAVLRLAGGDAWTAGLIAAGIGGDTDTIGAIAGAMAGALTGARALPAEARARLAEVNRLDIEPLARGLLALRARVTGAPAAEAAR